MRGDGGVARSGGVACALAVVGMYVGAGLLYAPGSLSLVAAAVAGLGGIVAVAAAAAIFRYFASGADWFRSDSVGLVVACVAAMLVLRAYVLRWPSELFPWLVALALGGAFLVGAGLGVVTDPFRRRRFTGPTVVLVGLLLPGAGLWWLLNPGTDPYPRAPLDSGAPAATLRDDPAAAGPFAVEALTYGSGRDPHRPEYGEGVTIRTESVDLGPALPEWSGFRADHREWYWGFGIDEAPINGRMHLPAVEAGDRRPVALVVHGNHRMEDFSDAGYAYLTEMLASHGVAAVSVDGNFLNGSWSGDFGGREMPARGILLLEHLAALREMDRDPGSPLHRRLDFDRVALVGHSRGGEAAAIATAFNRLDHFPDRADMEFDYGFGVRSVVAVAQIDRRYSRRIQLDDVHFLALQGTHDTDEPSFHGLRQYNRTHFSGRPLEGQVPWGVKAGLLLHGGNHGQFNSTWGMDSGLPGSLWINRAPLVSEETQRRVAASYVAAFLRVTLLGQTEWLPLLRDYRAGRRFLPEVPYLNQYSDGRTGAVATFEEDLDLTTGTAPGATLHAEGFARWREEEVLFRDGSKQGTSAVRLRIEADADAPMFEVRFAEGEEVVGADELVFSVTWIPDRDDPSRPPPALSLQAELVEGACEPEAPCAEARFQPVTVASPEPAFEVRFLKSARMNEARYRRLVEAIPQYRAISVRDFTSIDAPASIRAIRLSFVGNPPGDVLLDDVGWRRAAPGAG